MRCGVRDFKEQELASTVVLNPQDFIVRIDAQSDPLPRYQVNSFSSRKQPVAVTIQNLLTEAGIQVKSEEGVYPVVSVKSLKGELSNVLEEIAQKTGVFYTYNSENKILTLTPKSQVVVQLPHNRQVMMAVIDAISGVRFAPIMADWELYQISLIVNREELNKLRQLMASFLKDRYLLLAQMNLYEMHPLNANSHWNQIISDFGASRFASSRAGLGGTLLVLKSGINVLQMVAKAMENYQVLPMAQGQMLVPSGWRVHFNLGECALNRPYEKLSVSLRSKIKDKKTSQNVLSIDTKPGEVAFFDFSNALDQEALVVGVPVPGKPNVELLLTLKFSYINLIKKGE